MFYTLITKKYLNNRENTHNFIEEEDFEKGFSEHYEKNIKPLINEFDIERLSLLDKYSSRARISFIIILIISPIIGISYNKYKSVDLFLNDQLNISFFYLPILIFIILLIIIVNYFKLFALNYNSKIKEKIIPSILSFYGNSKYFMNCGKRISEFKESLIIPKYDREYSEDRIIIEYKNVEIDLFETRLIKVKHTKGKKRKRKKITMFKGLVISFKIFKDFSGKTILKKDTNNLIINFFNEIKLDIKSDLERVELEDVIFEKMFEVYSTDQIEARYLLTTSFMERIREFSDYKGEAILCSFYNKRLLMLIPYSKNLFEPSSSILQPTNFTHDSKKILKDLNSVFNVVDNLKLDMDLGL